MSAHLTVTNCNLFFCTIFYRQCHEGAGNAHFGRDKTICKVEERFYWSGMFKDIMSFVETCDKCQKTNPKLKKTVPSLHPIPVPSQAWKQVSIFHTHNSQMILVKTTKMRRQHFILLSI